MVEATGRARPERLWARDVSSQAFPVFNVSLPRTIKRARVTGKAWDRGYAMPCIYVHVRAMYIRTCMCHVYTYMYVPCIYVHVRAMYIRTCTYMNRTPLRLLNPCHAFLRYYTSRAKILSKCAKYPFLVSLKSLCTMYILVSHLFLFHKDDYQRAVDEYDQKVFVSFKLILRELRNIYVS